MFEFKNLIKTRTNFMKMIQLEKLKSKENARKKT